MPNRHPLAPLHKLFVALGRALWDQYVRYLLAITFTTIAFAALFYHFVEGWSLLDSVYFSTVTLATVGYGDFAPQTASGKIFTIIYVVCGVGIFVATGAALADRVILHTRPEDDPASGPTSGSASGPTSDPASGPPPDRPSRLPPVPRPGPDDGRDGPP